MKYINKFMFLMVAALSLLTACQDEAKLGDLLYPVPADDPTPRLYAYTMDFAGLDKSSKFAQTPVELVAPLDKVEFPIRLSKPVNHDVVVTLCESPELAAEYNGEAVALPAGTVEFENATLTIPAGALQATEKAVVSITDASKLAEVEDQGIVAITFTTDATDVKTSEEHGVVYWTLTKEFTNVYCDGVDGLTQIARSEWTPTAYRASYASEMWDEEVSSWNYGMITMNSGYITIDFGAPRTLAAMAYVVPQFATYTRYGIGEMLVETSDDASDWTSQGTCVMNTPADPSIWTAVKFFSTVTARYYRFSPTKRCDGATSGSCYIGEIRMYE